MSRKILITGGTGFLASELLTRFKSKKQIRVIARNEGKLLELKNKYPDIEIIPGDIADGVIVQKAMKGIDEVYHLAAFKHVRMAEYDVYQCVRTNILGTINLLNSFNGSKFVAISTDKAAKVSGIYGATKLILEGLIRERSQVKEANYRIIRYGNVLYSTGSILCKWKDQIKRGEMVTITDPEITRYYFSVKQAADLIFQEGELLIVPKMKAVKLGTLLKAMIQKYSKTDIKVQKIGLQPGENMHETLDGVTFSNEAEQYTLKEIKKLI